MKMGVNASGSPKDWKTDIEASIEQYNAWYKNFAPSACKSAINECRDSATDLMLATDYLRNLAPELIIESPNFLVTLRMACSPVLATDRLAGLAGVAPSRLKTMEKRSEKLAGTNKQIDDISSLLETVSEMLDKSLMPWLDQNRRPNDAELDKAVAVITDRLSRSLADPAIRNEQERRQLKVITNYLEAKGYSTLADASVGAYEMPHGTYSTHKSVSMFRNAEDDSGGMVSTPIDIVIMPLDPTASIPVLVECKSAGDATNTNKRRKEEGEKAAQLRATYGPDTTLYLFLCGYFNEGYLEYESSNGLDWIWEHRVEDFDKAGV